MHEQVTAQPPRKTPSRKVAVYAGLWVLAASLGQNTLGTLLLASLFGILTLWSVGKLIVTETKAASPARRTYALVLYIAVWLFWLSLTNLKPLWGELFVIFAHVR